MSIQQDKENNMNLWKFIEKILDFILCKLLRLKINKTQWELLMQFVKFERAIINERTRNGRIARLNENKWVGGKPSLGYKVNKDGKFEIDEDEAKIVKNIFKLRSKGLSLSKIGAKYGFSKQKVDYILKNKNYIGVFEYNGKKEKNSISIEIEPIVSKYLWNKVNLKK